ncbi:precorrin-2 C(20)-methyltransferase [Clostridiaceae bacterium 68-1-5]|uniref:Precorrin-2 C(20)-methyltransferase n=1 Tax=Suipraeoptans intestinalis TaxID=2606628 RepID=A0A6N7URF4_9FIRM|nr:precorrin-2 C(20)-methyltransferase [Suipraeoptans intestinalis]MSR93291.1 precorrin-2 C(20)-methyltransferase [Suipraeoptans intestinalis]
MKQKMAGKLYGVGVGPGDWEYLTLKAVRIIEECDVIAAPGKIPEQTTAYQIAQGACPFLSEKEVVGIDSPMTKDKKVWKTSHDLGVKRLAELLEENKKIAFLTLGDPTIYSTYMYLHQDLKEMGYETEIISGVPSFCAAAAAVQMSIGERKEEIHIIPASYDVREALKLKGMKIFMKMGSQFSVLKELLKKRKQQVTAVERCTMEGEKHYYGTEELPDAASYYTLVFVREGEEV